MTDEEIIRLIDERGGSRMDDQEELITFARRIAAKQREIDAAICERETLAMRGQEYSYCADAIRSQK